MAVSVLVTVTFGEQQFACSLQFRVEACPYVVLGLDWFALFQEYFLSTGVCLSVARPDGMLLSSSELVVCRYTFRNDRFVARGCLSQGSWSWVRVG